MANFYANSIISITHPNSPCITFSLTSRRIECPIHNFRKVQTAENCCSLREVFYFLVSYGVARGVSAGRDTKGGRKPGAPFRVKPQVFCLYALTVTKKLTGLREKANFKQSTVLFNMYSCNFFLKTPSWTVKLIEASGKASLLNGCSFTEVKSLHIHVKSTEARFCFPYQRKNSTRLPLKLSGNRV